MKIRFLQIKMLSVISASCLITLLALMISPIQCQQNDLFQLPLQNPCAIKTTCRECIQTSGCAWCLNPDFGDKTRCFHPSSTSLSTGCGEQYTWNPDNEQRVVIGQQLTRTGGAVSSAGGGYASGAYGSSSFSSSSSKKETFSSSSGFSASGAYGGSGSSQGSSSGSYGESASRITQIYPQRVSLKLRASKSIFVSYLFLFYLHT